MNRDWASHWEVTDVGHEPSTFPAVSATLVLVIIFRACEIVMDGVLSAHSAGLTITLQDGARGCGFRNSTLG